MPVLALPVGIPRMLTWGVTWLLWTSGSISISRWEAMLANFLRLSPEGKREIREHRERTTCGQHVEFAGALSLKKLNHKKPLHSKWELRSPGINISQHGSKPYKNRGSIVTLLISLDNLGRHIGWIWNQHRDTRLAEFLRRFSEGGM